MLFSGSVFLSHVVPVGIQRCVSLFSFGVIKSKLPFFLACLGGQLFSPALPGAEEEKSLSNSVLSFCAEGISTMRIHLYLLSWNLKNNLKIPSFYVPSPNPT